MVRVPTYRIEMADEAKAIISTQIFRLRRDFGNGTADDACADRRSTGQDRGKTWFRVLWHKCLADPLASRRYPCAGGTGTEGISRVLHARAFILGRSHCRPCKNRCARSEEHTSE